MIALVISPLVLWNSNLNSEVAGSRWFRVPKFIVEARSLLHVVNCDHVERDSEQPKTNYNESQFAFLCYNFVRLITSILKEYARGVCDAYGDTWILHVVCYSEGAILLTSAVLLIIVVKTSNIKSFKCAGGNICNRRCLVRNVTTVGVRIVLIKRSRLWCALSETEITLNYVVWNDSNAVKFAHYPQVTTYLSRSCLIYISFNDMRLMEPHVAEKIVCVDFQLSCTCAEAAVPQVVIPCWVHNHRHETKQDR